MLLIEASLFKRRFFCTLIFVRGILRRFVILSIFLMEFEFIRNTLMGEYYVKSSMGHEVVGRWLQEEIGKNIEILTQVEQLIVTARTQPQQEYVLEGTEISLCIEGDEVCISENSLGLANDQALDSGFELYESESSACCGIDDFSNLIEQWRAFLTTK